MSLAIVHTRAQLGLESPPVCVEVHLSNGLPSLSIVGLPETAVKESKDRVRSALLNSQFEFPARRITVNLAPADLPKDGGRYDLAIALGILCASGQLPQEGLGDYEFLGELALSGQLRSVRGALPAAIQAGKMGRALVLPEGNAEEVAQAWQTRVLGTDHLLGVCAHLQGRSLLEPWKSESSPTEPDDVLDLAEIKGQHQAKRALEIAAAGNLNLLMSGPPGTGKTMLASRLPGLLPPLTVEQRMEVAVIRSVCGADPDEVGDRPPFRSPHHTASGVSLVGGGSIPRPGEITLAHHGVLFLDELPEYSRKVLDVLREPLESGEITISRAAQQVSYPARFQLVAAMNPCPCGYYGDSRGRCHCSPDQVRRYQERISGPLLDRIDLHVPVPALERGVLSGKGPQAEASEQVRERVFKARERQQERRGLPNAQISGRQIEQDCALKPEDGRFLERALERLGLSARAYHRILKVARTIADLEGREMVVRNHLLEALNYRRLH